MDNEPFMYLDAAGALKVAIQSEIDTYHMYRRAYSENSSEESRKLLWTLAEEERDHRRHLEGMYKKITGKRLRSVNLQYKRRLFDTLEPDQPPLKVLESALRDEGASLRFYRQLAAEARDRSGRLMFAKLAEEEEGHIALLEAEQMIRLKESRRSRPRAKKSARLWPPQRVAPSVA